MGLSAGVWFELVLLLAALFAAIFGGAWVLRWFFNRRRESDDVADDTTTLTLEVTTLKGCLVSARLLSDDLTDRYGALATPPPSPTLGELREAVDAALVAWYRKNVAPKTIVVDYAMYLWNEGEITTDLAEQIGTDWLVFDVEESQGEFTATNEDTGLTATAGSLDALPPAVQVAIATRWPSLARDVPGMMTWQRILNEGGFVPYRKGPRLLSPASSYV